MVPRIPSWTKGVAVAVLPVPPRPFVDKRCCRCSSPCPSASLRGQKVLQLQFSVVLRGSSWTKSVAVAVLPVPPRPFVDKRCCRCSSPCPSASLRGQKVLQLQFSVSLRVPSWTKGVAVAVLRGPSVALRGQKVLQLQFSVSLCGPSWTKGVAVLQFSVSLCGPSWTKGVAVLQFSVSLRGSSWTKSVAVAVLRVPPRPFVDKRCCSCSSPWSSVALRGQKVLQLQFSPSLRVPSWTKGVAVAVLRVPPRPFVDKRCCSCSSPCPSVALRGQKVLQLQFSVSLCGPSWTKGVAVAVLRVPPWLFVDKKCCSCSSPCPSVALRGQKVLQLQFSVSLRGSSWTKGVAVAVLRGPPWPFVDKRCCSCSSPWSSVALRGQKVLQLQFSVSLCGSSWTKGVAVAVLRGPSWTKGVAVAVLRVPPWIKKPFFLPYRVY